MKYLGAGGQILNSQSVHKEINTLAINLNLNSYMENIKIRT